MLIKNAKVVFEDGVRVEDVRVEDKLIKEIGCNIQEKPGEETCDFSGLYLLPGFVDTHTHGSGGSDFMDGSVDAVINASICQAKHGTTTCLPTSLASSDDDLFLFLDNVKEAKMRGVGAKIAGVHLEGPYFDIENRGAQDPKYIINPNKAHYMGILEKADGLVKRWTFAPELEGSEEFVKDIVKLGILASGGHTNATYDEISRAYDWGMTELTHFYSGMSGIRRVGGFRILGAIEAGYLIDDLYVEIIADGMHLPPELLEFIFRFKRDDRIIACSDSMRAAGMGDGPSILGPLGAGTDVIVEDGIAKMPDRTCFAGSVATGERLAKTLYCIMHLPLDKVSRILSLQPAKTIGLDKSIGSIASGKAADLVVADENMDIKTVFIDGKRI